MLLFDTGRRLEKAFTAEQFDALVEVLERREDKAATREDLRESELRTQLEIEKTRRRSNGFALNSRRILKNSEPNSRRILKNSAPNSRRTLRRFGGKWRESNTICSNGRSPAGWLLLRSWRRGSTGLGFEPARALFRPLFQGAFCFLASFLLDFSTWMFSTSPRIFISAFC